MIRRLFSIAAALGAGACTVIAGVSSMEIEETPPASPSTKTVESPNGSNDEVDEIDGPGRPNGGSSTGSSSSSTSSSGGGGSPDDDAGTPSGDPNKPLTATFDTTCDGWSTNGQLTWEPAGRNGGGACRLCATTAGETSAERTVKTSRSGYAQLTSYLRRASGSVESGRVSIRVPGIQVSVNGALHEDWTQFKNTKLPSVSAGASITAIIRMPSANPGDCVGFDDTTITLRD